MRVQIFSDLHLEYRGNPLPPVSPDADVVVLAGDLAPVRTNRIGEVMRAWNFPDLLYVPGNHEWYGSEIDSARLKLKGECWDHGVELLDPRVVDRDEVRFVGATLWTDFRLDPTPGAEARAHHEVGDFMPDFNGAIRHFDAEKGLLTTGESARRHAAHRAFIERELARAEAEGVETVVVITHHAPSPVCVRPWYRDSKVNAGFASNLDEVIERYRPRLWIHGHMHDRVDERIGQTRIIANPHGFSLTEGADFDPNLIVTL